MRKSTGWYVYKVYPNVDALEGRRTTIVLVPPLPKPVRDKIVLDMIGHNDFVVSEWKADEYFNSHVIIAVYQ